MNKSTNHALLLIILFCFSLNAGAQVNYKRHLQLAAGRSIHGSGDLAGMSFQTEYGKAITNKWRWVAGIGGSVHDGSQPIFYTAPSGREVDGSVRYTVAGVQANGMVGLRALGWGRYEMQFMLGGLLRYQSGSLPDIISTYYPAASGLPMPVTEFHHFEPQRIFSAGALLQLRNQFRVGKQHAIGIHGSFQLDTNGDVLRDVSLSVTRLLFQ